jgi:hypothetical protein
MSIKLSDISREDLEKLIAEHGLKPALQNQNPYIANGPHTEMLAGRKPNGRYDVQLLDKKQVEESVEKTIQVFREFAKAAKSG